MKIEKFEDLEIWKEAKELYKYIFEVTEKCPFCDDYKFRDQIRASSGSVMDNIAEGFERNGNKEFIQFLFVAKGSCGECRSQSYRAFDYNYIEEDILQNLILQTTQLSKKLSSFMGYLKRSVFKGLKNKKPVTCNL